MIEVDLGEAQLGPGRLDVGFQPAPADVHCADVLAGDLGGGAGLQHLRFGGVEGGQVLIALPDGHRAVPNKVVIPLHVGGRGGRL